MDKHRGSLVIAILLCWQSSFVAAQSPPFDSAVEMNSSMISSESPDTIGGTPEIPGSLKLLVTMSVFSLAPALLMMTTCFVRFSIVFGLLKQAIGTPGIPPPQVMTALSLFLTFLVMSPVWQQAYDRGVRPYLEQASGETPIGEYQAFQETMIPLREFMGGQIEQTHNQDAVWMFWDYHTHASMQAGTMVATATPESYQDLPLSVLLPAYLVSELKTAFLIGFQIFLPFLVIDLLVSSVLASSGLMMLPPVLVSLPFKLLLFVLIDGWTLVVGTMLDSIRPLTG